MDKQFNIISKAIRNSNFLRAMLLEKTLESFRISLRATSSEKNKISFIFISDLLDIIMRNIDKTLEFLCENLGDEEKGLFSVDRVDNLAPALKNTLKKYSKDISNNKAIIKEIEKLKKAREQYKKMRIVLDLWKLKILLETMVLSLVLLVMSQYL